MYKNHRLMVIDTKENGNLVQLGDRVEVAVQVRGEVTQRLRVACVSIRATVTSMG